jgi:hypothetical protein
MIRKLNENPQKKSNDLLYYKITYLTNQTTQIFKSNFLHFPPRKWSPTNVPLLRHPLHTRLPPIPHRQMFSSSKNVIERLSFSAVETTPKPSNWWTATFPEPEELQHASPQRPNPHSLRDGVANPRLRR